MDEWYLDPYDHSHDPNSYLDADGKRFTKCPHCGKHGLTWAPIVEDVYKLQNHYNPILTAQSKKYSPLLHSMECKAYAKELYDSERLRIGNDLAHYVSIMLELKEGVSYCDAFEEMAMRIDDWNALTESGEDARPKLPSNGSPCGEQHTKFLARWGVDIFNR